MLLITRHPASARLRAWRSALRRTPPQKKMIRQCAAHSTSLKSHPLLEAKIHQPSSNTFWAYRHSWLSC